MYPKCKYCGKFLNPQNDDVKMEVQYGFMSIDEDYYYHESCQKKLSAEG